MQNATRLPSIYANSGMYHWLAILSANSREHDEMPTIMAYQGKQ